MAGSALHAIRRLGGDINPFGEEGGQTNRGVALGATAGHHTVFIPIAECCFRTGEVAGVNPGHRRHVDRLGQRLVQVINRVVQQLDDVLATVGVSAGVLDRSLVVVGGLEQTRGPRLEGIRGYGLVVAQLPVGIRVGKEVRIGVRVVENRGPRHFGRIGLNIGIERFLQALQLKGDALFHIAVAVVVDLRARHADILQIFD